MQHTTDPKNNPHEKDTTKENTSQETRQQQTDPNLTELKGLTDPEVPLEPKNNDNPFNE